MADQSQLNEDQEIYSSMPAHYSQRAAGDPSDASKVLHENLQLLEQPPALSEREQRFAYRKPLKSSMKSMASSKMAISRRSSGLGNYSSNEVV